MVLFLTRYIINRLILLWFFNELRMNASSFIPGSSMLFSGGPLFDIAYLGIKSFQLGPKGASYRSQLVKQVARLGTPLHVYYIKRAFEYFEQGDWYRGLLQITATPVNEKSLSELLSE